MKFVDIVEIVEDIENKLSTLSESKLELLETILVEGREIEFDILHHMDYLIEFVDSYSDEKAELISATIDGKEILNIMLESIRINASDKDIALNEAIEKVENLEQQVLESDEEIVSVPLLSVVTNTLTEMIGEENVEKLPAEMVFDIVEATKELDISDSASEFDIETLIEEISTKLMQAISEGLIDFDSDNYDGETLEEFLADYSDTEDLLEEMEQVNEEILSESENAEVADLLRKAKKSTVLLEAKKTRCKTNDSGCQMKKAKAAKRYYKKHELPGGGKVEEDFKLSTLKGKLRLHVQEAMKRAKERGKPLKKLYIQYVLIPSIVSKMRRKHKKMTNKSKLLKPGMKQ